MSPLQTTRREDFLGSFKEYTPYNRSKTYNRFIKEGLKVIRLKNIYNQSTKESNNLFFLDLERNNHNGDIYCINTANVKNRVAVRNLDQATLTRATINA